MKTKIANPDYKPQWSGVLKFRRGYKNTLLESGDADYINLANMEGERISFMKVPYIGYHDVPPNVNICEPAEMNISISILVNHKEL